MTVVVAPELDDLILPGDAPGQSDRRHAGLGPAGYETHLFDGGVALADEFCEFGLPGRRCAEGQTVPDRVPDGGQDARVAVAEQVRPPGHDVVDVPVAVGVIDLAAFAPGDEQRVHADGAKSADRRVDPAGNILLSLLEEGVFLLFRHVHPPWSLRAYSLSQRATSSAWYVMMRSAPARFMDVRFSRTMRRSSIHPFSAAAFTMEYSPETL